MAPPHQLQALVLLREPAHEDASGALAPVVAREQSASPLAAGSWLAFFDPLPEPVLLVTGEGVILEANAAAEKLLGRTRSELCRLGLSGVCPEGAASLLEIMQQCATTDVLDGVVAVATGPEPVTLRCTAYRVHVSDAPPLVQLRFGARVNGEPTGFRLRELGKEVVLRRVLQIELEESKRVLLQLQHLTSGLAEARTVDHVTQVVVERGMDTVGARSAAVLAAPDDGSPFRLVRQLGYSADWDPEHLLQLLLDGGEPAVEAARRGKAVLIERPEPRDEAGRASHPGAMHVRDSALAVVPLTAGRGCLGIVTFGFAEARPFTAEKVDLMLMIAHQSARTLERIQLFAAERRARVEAEEARRRAAFLCEVSAIMGSSLDYAAALEGVARLAVPHLADWCVVEMLDGGDEATHIVHHRDPEKVALAREYRRRYPLDPSAAYGVGRVIRTGRTMLSANVDAHFDEVIQDPEQRQSVKRLGIGSMLVVPMTARERTFGALLFMQAGSGRRFSPEDVEMAEAVGRRCAVAIDNARLHEEARRAERRKDEFLAMLGHELRNPLAPILTALQLMRLVDDGTFVRERAVIERQTRHLASLVDDLLDVSRIARGTIELRKEVCTIAAIVERAVEMTSLLVEQRRHRLTVSMPKDGLLVYADPARLAQVVANLLSNAAKYSELGREISIEVEAIGDEVQVRVRDTGNGIARESLPFIFDSFVQDERSVDRAQGGLGLGLTITRSLIELHGGSVSACSEGLGKGSEFTIRLPRATAAASPRAAESCVPATASRAARVLVVDDNVDAAEVLAAVLERLGYTTLALFDAASALEAAEEFRPDVALLDIGLPAIDGYELGSRLRRRPSLATLPLVAITGYGQEGDRMRTKNAGFQAHFVKPVDMQTLGEAVERVLGTGRSQEWVEA